MKKSIGLVIPAFAPPGMLLTLLDSISNQTVAPDELVIVDDRHSSESTDLLKNFASRTSIPTTLCVNEFNLGVSQSTKKAIALCQSDFVGFVDSDDYLLPNAISRFVSALQVDPDVDVYSSEFAYFRNSLFGVREIDTVKRDRANLIESLSFEQAQVFDNIATHFKIVKRKLVENLEFHMSWDGVQDQILNWKVILGSNIFLDDEVTYMHRVHDDQLTNAVKAQSQTNLALNKFRLEYVSKMLGIERDFKLSDQVQSQLTKLSWLIRSEIDSACEGEFVELNSTLRANPTHHIFIEKFLTLDVEIIKAPRSDQSIWRHSVLERLSGSGKLIGVYLNSGREMDWDFVLAYASLFDFVMIDNPLLLPVLRPHIPKETHVLY